jgi:hypothetical protein
MEFVSCPTCHAPAEVEPRAVLGSTSGPVAHVKVICVRRHWYLMPRDMLDPPVTADAAPSMTRTT